MKRMFIASLVGFALMGTTAPSNAASFSFLEQDPLNIPSSHGSLSGAEVVTFDWVATPCAGGMEPVFRTYGLDFVSDQVERNPYKAELIRPLGRSLEQMFSALWQVQEVLASEPVTLLHGDPHLGNTYLLPDGTGGLLDWQLMVRGRWAHDLTYCLVTALDIEGRHTTSAGRRYRLAINLVCDVPGGVVRLVECHS